MDVALADHADVQDSLNFANTFLLILRESILGLCEFGRPKMILTASRHEFQSIGHSFSLHLDEHAAVFVSVTSHQLFGPEYMGGCVSLRP
jgi:hypothetical protein